MSASADTAIPELLDAHGGRIYALGLKMCGGPEDAADLVQDTFFQAFRKWGQFEGRSSPATWLYSIAARACHRRRRRRSREPSRMESLSSASRAGDGSVGEVPAGEMDPLERQLRHEAVQSVNRAISTLPDHFRLPLLLKELADFSVSEVAEVLGIKPATVRTRVHRARLLLREALSAPVPDEVSGTLDHAGRVCLDLIAAKQDALDRGVEFPLPPEVICARCRSTFAALELARDACVQLGRGELPEALSVTLRQHLLGDS